MSPKTLACWTLLWAAVPARAVDPGSGTPPGPPAASAPGESRLSGLGADEQMVVPPGAPEDQARWKAGHEVNQQIAVELSVSSRLQWNGRNKRYAERLEVLASAKEGPKAARAAELLPRYRKVALDNWQTATRQWPVDKTRACQYPLLDLQSAMQPGGATRGITLLVARDTIDDCLGKARPVVMLLAGQNRELEGLQESAEALLPPLREGQATAPAQPPGRPAEAPAGTAR